MIGFTYLVRIISETKRIGEQSFEVPALVEQRYLVRVEWDLGEVGEDENSESDYDETSDTISGT